ncbi:Dabb family protein [Plantactinospora sp. CA-294935]|uniref:Dabb family protein n=1 Tax=Plantactinospora sp. CA-294935 TaxID=3240012 RepID=UPI003D93C625
MIYHGIRFSLKPGISDEEVAAGLKAMHDASSAIPSITSFVIGRDFGGEYDYGAVSVIEDLAGYEVMMNHPAHLEIDRAGLPLTEKFMSFDITDDPDPEMGAKIADIHRRRYADNPDVAGLVADLDDYSGSAAPSKHGN